MRITLECTGEDAGREVDVTIGNYTDDQTLDEVLEELVVPALKAFGYEFDELVVHDYEDDEPPSRRSSDVKSGRRWDDIDTGTEPCK